MRRGGGLSSFIRSMPWSLQYYFVMIPLTMSMVSVVNSGRKLPPVYWNSTNSIFNRQNPANEIDITIGDSIDIICPKYASGTPWQKMEYYTIYMVNSTIYEDCIIYNTSDLEVRMLINCSSPQKNLPQFYTLIIQKFQSIPGNPDFHPGESYYFITTSHGTPHGITNQYKGACDKKNLKLKLNVQNVTISKPHGTPTTTRQPIIRTTPHYPERTKPPTRWTTRKTTSTTATPTTRRTTPKQQETPKPTDKDIPGNLPDENVIHAGGPKNTGYISDSSGHRTMTSGLFVLLSVTMAVLCR